MGHTPIEDRDRYFHRMVTSHFSFQALERLTKSKRASDSEFDSVTSEPCRILNVLIWTNWVAPHVLHIYREWCNRGVTTHSTVRMAQVFLLYRFEACEKGTMYLFCLFKFSFGWIALMYRKVFKPFTIHVLSPKFFN